MKEFKFKINGAEYQCTVEQIEGGLTEVTVNGKKYVVETEKPAAPAPQPVAPKVPQAPSAPKAAPAPAPESPKAAPAPKAAAAGVQVKSPLPGSVIKVNVSVGQAVKKGDTLLTLESMKMENPILAEQDGTVAQVAVAAGQTVMQDDLLIVLG